MLDSPDSDQIINTMYHEQIINTMNHEQNWID